MCSWFCNKAPHVDFRGGQSCISPAAELHPKQLEFFNWHLEMNLLVQWNTKSAVGSAMELLIMISEGVKVQIWGAGAAGEISKCHPFSRDHRLESQHMQTPLGVLYKLHMVSLGYAPTTCFAPQTPRLMQLEFFNWHLEMNLLVQRNTKL